MHSDLFKGRSNNIRVLIALTVVIIMGILLYMQLITSRYRDKAQATAIQKHVKYPARGTIFDREGKLIVTSDVVYDLMVTYNQVSPQMDTTFFCKLLGISKKSFKKRLNKNWRDPKYRRSVPFVFIDRLPAQLYARLQESMHEFPGFYTEVRSVRRYPYAAGAHVLGYISEVNQEQVDASDGKYQPRDYIGSSGLELAYEDDLRGEKGVSYILKDNLGRVIGNYENGRRDEAATAGKDIVSTLDMALQQYGEQLMQNKAGAIVAIEPATGEILSMVSTPAYNPNLLTINSQRGARYVSLLRDSLKPLYNRAVTAKYPPGSIYKTVMALAALEMNAIQPNTGFTCNYGYTYGARTYGCHGHVYPSDVPTAIQHSCNSYFFQTLRRCVDMHGYTTPQNGLDTLNSYLTKFGIGRRIGVDVSNESPGNLPSSAYYDRLYPKEKGSWRSPGIMSIGIGQGEVELTTLQMANLAAIIANKGCYYAPHLLRAYTDGSPKPPALVERHCTGVNKAYFDLVVEGMERVVRAGTGRSAYIEDITVCGKTGTSQNPHGEDHSVFFAFAPRENPKIAIAVYVENGTWGSTYGAPIASLMIEKYLNGQIRESRKYLEDRMLQADLLGDPKL